MLDETFADEELLFRGIIESNWDFEKNRPSSAVFKDSKGVSVDRSAHRKEEDCIAFLRAKRNFFKVCSIKAAQVRENKAVILYKPLVDNIYHSEIHDSMEQVQIKGSKAKRLRDSIFDIYT